MKNKCIRFEKLLPAYLHGELYEKDYDALRAHLETCASCRAELEALHTTFELAGRVMSAVPTPARMTAWRHLPKRDIDLRSSTFTRLCFSPQFRAALATGTIFACLFFVSGLFVVFTVVQKPSPEFSPPPPLERPKMKLRKLRVPTEVEKQPPSLRSNIGVSTEEAVALGIDTPETAAVRNESQIAEGGESAPAADDLSVQVVTRPHMKLRKPKVAVRKSSQPKPSSRIVAKVRTSEMPEITLPDLDGAGEGMLGGSGSDVAFLDLPDITETAVFGREAGEPEPVPQQPSESMRLYSDPFNGEVADEASSAERWSEPAFGRDVEEERSVSSYGFMPPVEDVDSDGMDDLFGGGPVTSDSIVGYSIAGGRDSAVSKKVAGDMDVPAQEHVQGDLLERGQELIQAGDLEEAMTVFESVLAENPHDKRALTGLRRIADQKADEEQERLAAERAAAVADIRSAWSSDFNDALALAARERRPAVYNPYMMAAENPFSTFAIDVDTASYGLARQQLLQGALPDTEAVRTEEFINSFEYDYRPPAGNKTFAVYAEMAPAPFRGRMELLKIGVKGRRIGRDDHRKAVLTLVIDTSGSMSTPERLGLVKQSLALLLEQLDPGDEVAIVQFGGDAHLVLEHTPAGEKATVLDAINALQPGGPTQFDKGLELGYRMAVDGFNAGDSNRIIIMSDGVANLGELDPDAILEQVAGFRTKGIYLSVLGFGAGAYDDELLERLANRGDGMYAYVDTIDEARQLFVERLASTLHVIAGDVKIQVEFNPDRVVRYRQLGYENRQLTKEQFRDDTVDAGEVGSGQSVTALYDVELKPDGSERDPIATVYVRYRRADNGLVEEISRRVMDASRVARFEDADVRFRLAACVAEFAERLRRSPYAEGTDMTEILERLQPVVLALDLDEQVRELQQLISIAAGLENR